MVNRTRDKQLLVKIDTDPGLTCFQKKVLKTVLAIPKGKVRSYLWIAERVGAPGSARAVGNAVGKNPYAPRVPCHRVIRSDGSIGGYSGGIAKKMELLRKEGVEIQKIVVREQRTVDRG
ncbi:MAG: MGMT family protein [Candidatus Omnitrophota bacterium]|nr:MGMT family protein [Candidatus Omnitrophota bacterium]